MFNKNLQNTFKKFTKGAVNEIIKNVAVQNGRMIATDAYHLIDIPFPKYFTCPEGLYNPETSIITPLDINEYPKTSKIINDKTPELVLKVNIDYLANVVTALKQNGGKEIAIDLYGERLPIVFTTIAKDAENAGEKIQAMIMPIRN